MIRLLIITSLICGRIVSFAQNDLQKCSEEKNKEILHLINDGKGKDTAAFKQLLQLDKDWRNCVEGKVIPDFLVKTINGEMIETKKMKGKVVVANFWFTTCPPCIAEIPDFNRLVKEYKHENVEFLGFAINDKKKLKKFLKKTPFNFKIIPDAQTIESLFGVIEHPVTFIIDPESKVKVVWAGGNVGEKAKDEAYLKIKPVIDSLLKN